MMSSNFDLTAQQSAALDRRDVSIGLSAGAGCGKTFVLKERFLRHVAPGVEDDPIGRLVAITFTERAAREMRDRIRIGCRDKLEHCDEQQVAHWMELLRGLDAARISTIHSFCASLLRAHAVEAQLDPQFAVLDAANQQALLRRVVKDSLYRLLTEHDPHCMQFIRRHGLERTAELVRSLIQQQFRIDWSTFDDFDPETSAARWMEFWRMKLIPKLIRQFVESPLVRRLLELLNEHQPAHKTMQQRRELLLSVLPQLPESDNPGSMLEELAGAARVQGGGAAGAWSDPAVYEVLKNTLSELRADIGKLQKQLDVDEADVRAATEVSGNALHVVRYTAEHYRRLKQAEGVLDFDDLLLRTRDLLRTDASVRRRAAGGIGFLMVDEFQDTDPVQAEIVRLLCGNQLKTGKLFLVGDVKQSIYRFRRADPEVFRQLRSELPPRGQLPLTKNFRSQPEILNFVNCVCGPAMEAYEPLETDAEQLSPTPTVEFQFATPGPGEAAQVKNETAEGRRRREAKWIAARIAGFLSDPTPRIRTRRSTGGGFELRPAKRGDVAILFRSLTNVALYEEALREQGLDYYLVGGRAFYAQQEIYDWVNLCRFLDDADDEISLLGVLRSPLFSLSDDTIFALATRGGGLSPGLFESPPPQFLSPEQRRQATHARNVLTELRSLKDRLPLAELLDLTLERTGYDAALLLEYMGRRKLANLRKLIDKARQFDRTGRMTLKDFVVQLSESVTEQTDEELAATHPEVGDVIRLMTIHQSKGLEFPIVFVADMDWRPNHRTQTYFHPSLGPLVPVPKEAGRTRRNLGLEIHTFLEEQAEADETIRLLYVALTRAADYLILSAGLDQNRSVRSPWLRLLSERFDLQTGLPVVDPILGRVSLQHVAPDELPTIAVHQHMPEVAAETLPQSKPQLPLNQLRELVDRTEPAPWPSSLREIPPSQTLRQLSVSQLEVLDAELRPGEKSSAFENVERDVRDLEFEAAEFDFADMTTLGTLVHSVLERIDLRNPDPPATMVNAAIAAADETIRPEMTASMISRIEGFLDSSLRHELAAARRHFRELDFLLHWTAPTDSTFEATISGQIDCLAELADDSWIVVDYKTGRGGAIDDAALISKYDLQLAVYAMAAWQLIGRLPDRMELAIVGEKLVRIPVTMTDQQFRHIEERMTAVFQRNSQPRILSAENSR